MRTLVKVFSTTQTAALGLQVEEHIRCAMADRADEFRVEHGNLTVSRFSNENLEVQVDNVRDTIVVILHTQAPPVSEGLIELMGLLDAISNAHPRQTFVAFPYMPYARSDRKNRPRISVLGQRLPEILNNVFGVRRVLLVEPHAPHMKQYFLPTADEVPATPLMVDHIKATLCEECARGECTIVFADAGAAKRYEDLPNTLGIPPAYIHKSRVDHSESPTLRALTGDVRGKHCLLIDDEVLTGNTVLKDAHLLKEDGAKTVRMYATHAILADQKLTSEQLIAKLAASDIDQFIFTDTVPLEDKIAYAPDLFTVLPIAPLIGEAIKRMILGESLSQLHKFE
jgi:ribose-phosphate pyrophosphokinase